MKLPPIDLPARPQGLSFDIRAVVNGKFEARAEAGTITIFDVIGIEVTPNRIAAALRNIGPRPVVVQINSNGGDVFAAATIYNQLRGHSHPVTVQVLGMAASAASIIAMAGERIEIARNAQFMIHRSHGIAVGNAADMQSLAAILDKIDAGMAAVYEARTGIPPTEIAAMMAAETYMTADEAIENRFADELLERDAAELPRVAASGAPSSKRELEDRLRTIGLSRSCAVAGAAAAWPAISPEAIDFAPLAAQLRGQITEIENWR